MPWLYFIIENTSIDYFKVYISSFENMLLCSAGFCVMYTVKMLFNRCDHTRGFSCMALVNKMLHFISTGLNKWGKKSPKQPDICSLVSFLTKGCANRRLDQAAEAGRKPKESFQVLWLLSVSCWGFKNMTNLYFAK